jgi:hypothetical protein
MSHMTAGLPTTGCPRGGGHDVRVSERGNALLLILIAVVVFAALSFAVSQSGRQGGNINRESAEMAGSQMTQYGANLRTVVTRMAVLGVTVASMDFSAGSGSTKIFDSDFGGGAPRVSPPSGVGNAFGGTTGATAGAWGFKDALHATNGYFILNAGSDAAFQGREIIMFLHDIDLDVCQQILRGIGISMTPAVNTIAVDYTSNGGSGLATGGIAGNTNTFDAIPGQPYACISNGGVYDYYHALVEQ